MTVMASETQNDHLLNRRYDPNIGAVNELCDSLRDLKPGSEVSYVDPIHDVDECRILSLHSNIGSAHDSGFITAGDDDAAGRLLGVQWQIGLRPEYIMPWNVHPWFTPGESNGKLTPDQISAGLKPLLKLLALVPRASAIVAHGTEANRLAGLLLKTQNPLIWRRGLKTYKVRSLSGRSFGGSATKQVEWLEEMRVAYADAMARTGLTVR
ncbi:uracil-DNA glycosylase [Paeniglutamicibacter antarcticus]|uniref:Uracil-DNA glycosylase n=1 Tax=Arthrobacter terrae TaxID=2935737 RepID=A0A931CT75_9MICC|nr:uracil-DNA glycosylase [Arthrobacter terrae]MBG0740989.1 uracil-DNA glycosylase [Arthrobacter terrae]